jgi:hypothetical protein
MCIAIAKSIHEMHVSVFGMGKHKWNCYNSSQLTVTVIANEYEVAA